MNTASHLTPRQSPIRSGCLDCRAEFARHRAVQRPNETLERDTELDLLICPECGSLAVVEKPHERN